MSPVPARPFQTIESAHEFVDLLAESIDEAMCEVQEYLAAAEAAGDPRRVEALKLTLFKMQSLGQNMHKSRRLLIDLRSLRRLLFAERGAA